MDGIKGWLAVIIVIFHFCLAFYQNSSIVITCKAGSRKHLADWKNICIRTV